jgi:hypothetical protein
MDAIGFMPALLIFVWPLVGTRIVNVPGTTGLASRQAQQDNHGRHDYDPGQEYG